MAKCPHRGPGEQDAAEAGVAILDQCLCIQWVLSPFPEGMRRHRFSQLKRTQVSPVHKGLVLSPLTE